MNNQKAGRIESGGQTTFGYHAGKSISGTNCTAIGFNANVSNGYSNSTAIGYGATANASNKIRIGNSSVNAVEGVVAYSFPSDARFKENVKDDVQGLDFIMKFHPVSYNFDRLKFA